MHDAARLSGPGAALPTRTSRLFLALGACITRHAKLVVLVWLSIGLILSALAPPWELCCQDDDIHFLPDHCLSVQGYDLLESAFPNEVHGSKLVIAMERTSGALTSADRDLLDQIVASVEKLRSGQPRLGIRSITSYRHPLLGPRLISHDGRASLLAIGLESPFLAARTRQAVHAIEANIQPYIREQSSREEERPGDLLVVLTGPAGMGRDLLDAAYHGFDATTWATVILVILLSLLVYRAPLLALVPLLSITCAVWISLKLLAVCAGHFGLQLVNMTQVFVIVLLFGAGTDYCLFLISRYREELEKDHAGPHTLPRTLSAVGGALTASAGTVVCGLSMLGFAEFVKLRCTGPAVALSLVIGLLAALTLTPALLHLLGCWVFWPRSRAWSDNRDVLPFTGTVQRGGLIRYLVRHPWRVWVGSLLMLSPLALWGYYTPHTYGVCNELTPTAPSRQGLDLIRQHFPPGEMSPLTVLLPQSASWQTVEGQALIARLTHTLADLPNVADVRSLTQPLGDPNNLREAERWAGALATPALAQHYLGKTGDQNVTRLDVVLATDPFSEASLGTLDQIRARLQEELGSNGIRYSLFNVTAIMHDVARIHTSDTLRVNCLVMGSILLILLVLVRRPLVTVYLLLSVIFTYFIALGLSTVLGPWLLGEAWGELDWKVPFFLFTILVAVGEDYNIFLLSRILEERRNYPWPEATLRAVTQTGSTITSCGLIMAGTFATMLLGQVVSLRQMGLALAIGVLLDTFLVRLVLLPAFLLLWGRWMDRNTQEPARTQALRQAA